jgi:crotonobetaine/carnitine-CoA ligase
MCASRTEPTPVHALLRQRAEEAGAAPFLLFDGDERRLTLTYAQAFAAARAAAELLRTHGVQRGGRIHLDLANCPEFVVLLFAASMLGAVIVPTNPAATSEDMAFVLAHARPQLTVTEPARRAVVGHAAYDAGLDGHAQLMREDVRLAPAAGGDGLGAPVADADPQELLAVLYTSGTTSNPKGVCVTHANYLHVGRVVAEHLELRASDRWLVVLPLFHANAQYYCLMSALVAGASVALMGGFSASRWAKQARRHGATVASLFAAPIRMVLAQDPEPADADNRLRVVIYAQRVDEAQAVAFERRFGCGLLQLYGMTETIAPPLMNPLHDERRNATVGRPVGGVELRLRDPDGRPAELGELEVRGTPGVSLMAGYLNEAAATQAALADGWLRTGDVLQREPDGWYRFHDRVKDMIKSAGENIAAAEVERVIDTHPDVFESAVVGIPDPVRDEVVKAFVVPRRGAELSPDELIAWCRERMVKFKVPAEVAVVNELPRTSVGKVQKHRLR